MEGFTEIKINDNFGNPIQLIGSEWLLITATHETINPMTANWGALGYIWHKPAATIYLRPQRYTYYLMEGSDSFSLTFFPEENKEALKFCGSHSGRNTDKIAETGLTPFRTPTGNWGYREARLIIECKTMYYQDFTPDNFIDPTIDKLYSDNDYHRMYIGEILTLYQKSA